MNSIKDKGSFEIPPEPKAPELHQKRIRKFRRKLQNCLLIKKPQSKKS